MSIPPGGAEEVIEFIQGLWVSLAKNSFSMFLSTSQTKSVNQLSQNFKGVVADKAFIWLNGEPSILESLEDFIDVLQMLFKSWGIDHNVIYETACSMPFEFLEEFVHVSL